MAHVTITVEGGLFPGDLLDRIGLGDLEGQKPADFGFPTAGKFNEDVQSAFSDVSSYWDAFQRRLKRTKESPTTITRESWGIPLLERLGFALSVQRSGLVIGNDTYFVSHLAGEDATATPVHIVSIEQSLDKQPERGGRSPHALLQEYLNRSDALWGLVANGEHLRLLRASAKTAGPAYVDFNLRAMIEDNHYTEFALLYRLLHFSRFPQAGSSPNECRLERYFQKGIEEGGRVRDKLRDGVEETLKTLGSALLRHEKSEALRTRVQSGALSTESYYRQLLRLVYRFLFLFVVEERRLIFSPQAKKADQQVLYANYYSLSRLRDRAEHYFADNYYTDLWEGLVNTFYIFRDTEMAESLGLSALNGELFGVGSCDDVEQACCDNFSLLLAIRNLSVFKDNKTTRRVSYAGLDVEELGSVYESLLEYRPHINSGPEWVFELIPGTERKQTGSYYTPPELVRELINSALVPVVEDRLAKAKTKEDKEKALLDLHVCDPASGSGHFLLAAARRIGAELARVRTGETEPPVEAHRDAVRDVIRNCIYAVDKNPLAVDLCKVALWIEGHQPDLALSFLDHHVKCGDSLVGVFDLEVLQDGIPDGAYTPVTGDDKTAASYYKKKNNAEREGQTTLEGAMAAPQSLISDFEAMAHLDDRTPVDVHSKAELYEALRGQGTAYWDRKVACDLWTAAFFTPLQFPEKGGLVPTTDIVRKSLTNPRGIDQKLAGAAICLSQRNGVFHWPIEFPEVFADGGFDVVLGNPPFSAEISPNAARLLRSSGFPTSNGNSAALFIHRCLQSLARSGNVGLVAPKSITYSSRWMESRKTLGPRLISIWDCGQAWKSVLLEQVIFSASCALRTGPYAAGRLQDGQLRQSGPFPRELLLQRDILPCDIEPDVFTLLDSRRLKSIPMGSLCKTARGYGLQHQVKTTGEYPVLGGQNIQRYRTSGQAGFLCGIDLTHFDKWMVVPKVVYQNIVAHVHRPQPHIKITACYDDVGLVTLDTVNNIIVTDARISEYAIVALLNSRVLNWLAWRILYNKAVRTMHLDQYFLDRLPIPVSFLDTQGQAAAMAETVQRAYAEEGGEGPELAKILYDLELIVAESYGISRNKLDLILASFPSVDL